MGGTKATALAEHCRARGHSFLRFDYFGHGASSGDFRAGSIGRWAEDALAVIDELTEGPQILVGSSMGGWIALLAALARPGRIRGLIGIASAPDFTEDLIWNRLSAEQGRRFKASGELSAPSAYETRADPDHLSGWWRRAADISCCAGPSRSPVRCACCMACRIPTCPIRPRCGSPRIFRAPKRWSS